MSLQPLGIIAGTGLSDPDALGDAPNELVHAAGGGEVTEVLVDGRIVGSERLSTQVDTRDLLCRSRIRARDAAAAAHAVQEV